MTALPPHPLLDQLAQLQHDVAILREWAGLLDDAMQEFGASLQKYLPSTDAGELLRDASAWPTERLSPPVPKCGRGPQIEETGAEGAAGDVRGEE